MHLEDCLDMELLQTHNYIWVVFILSILKKSESVRERKGKDDKKFSRCQEICTIARAQN